MNARRSAGSSVVSSLTSNQLSRAPAPGFYVSEFSVTAAGNCLRVAEVTKVLGEGDAKTALLLFCWEKLINQAAAFFIFSVKSAETPFSPSLVTSSFGE